MKLLVVDDDEVMRKLLKEVLEKDGYRVQLAASGEDAVRSLRAETFPIVVSDIRMFETDGMAVLREAKKAGGSTAVILMTGFGSMEGAIEAIQEGAFDYISKPFRMDELRSVVSRAVKQWESARARQVELAVPRFEAAKQSLLGRSPRIVEVYKTLARAALSSSAVLVSGESGTGKELVARAIHDNSARRNHKFISFNCGAVSESELEAGLFGQVKKGLLAEAGDGTLFIEEIGAMPQSTQIRLLRFIQDGWFRSADADEPRRADVRVIAATNKDLEPLVRAGKFREDLFYKLRVIMIEIPPLRDRIEDLPELVNYFLGKYAGRSRKAVSHVSDEAMTILRGYSWPGNVMELEHAIEHAVAMTGTSVLFPEDFPNEIARRPGASQHPQEPAAACVPPDSLEDIERAHIMRVLQDSGFNKSRASEILGIDRATLYRKAQRYGIDLRGK